MKKPLVKAKSVRRGRPLGSKNKPKGLEKQIAHWEAEPRKPGVNFKALAQKLQNELSKSYVEVQTLESAIEFYRGEIAKKDAIINYLECRLA